MGFFLALDAGSANTECLLANEHQVLGRAQAEGISPLRQSPSEAALKLRGLIEETARKAGVSLAAVERACLGMADIKQPMVRSWAESTLNGMIACELILTGSDEIAMQAAFGDGPGVLVVAGKGSHVVGRCTNGARLTAGGWGPMLGDEGSSHWIGVEAIRSALRARDRGAASALLRDITQAWGVDTVAVLIAKAEQQPRPDFAVLAGVVEACASRGDKLSRNVLERAGEELAAQVSLVFGKMGAAACPETDTARLAFTGDVLAKDSVVLETLRAALKRQHPLTEMGGTPVHPIEGALARARRG